MFARREMLGMSLVRIRAVLCTYSDDICYQTPGVRRLICEVHAHARPPRGSIILRRARKDLTQLTAASLNTQPPGALHAWTPRKIHRRYLLGLQDEWTARECCA